MWEKLTLEEDLEDATANERAFFKDVASALKSGYAPPPHDTIDLTVTDKTPAPQDMIDLTSDSDD